MRRWLLVVAVLLLGGGAFAGTDICSGIISSRTIEYPQSARTIPAYNTWFTDPDLVNAGVRIKRITDVTIPDTRCPADGDRLCNIGYVKPGYSPIPAWNADESYFFLVHSGQNTRSHPAPDGASGGGYFLYDGRTYAYLRNMPIYPSQLETVFWDPVDPKLIYYPRATNHTFNRYNVDTGVTTVLHDFTSVCGANTLGGETHAGAAALDARKRFMLHCGTTQFLYEASTDTVRSFVWPGDWIIISNSGNYLWVANGDNNGTNHTFWVYDDNFNQLRELDIKTRSHSTMVTDATGRDAWLTLQFDGHAGCGGAGVLGDGANLFYLNGDAGTDGTCSVLVGPQRGDRYPWSGQHVSGTAFKNPGWIWSSIIGGCNNTTYCPGAQATPGYPSGNSYNGRTAPQPSDGINALDGEIIAYDTTGSLCRIMHHHTWGIKNTNLPSIKTYFAEPHVTASPTGTRALFASDWDNGNVVNTYVIELPSYTGAQPPTISTSSPLPAAEKDVAYTTTFAATGGTAPYAWTKTGTLCTGLTLSAAGVLSGTPTVKETCTFTVTATDANLEIDTKSYSLTVEAAPVAITTTLLAGGTIGHPYSAQLLAINGTAPYTPWTVSVGTLCDGLALSDDGFITGTPTTAETCSFTVHVTDAAAATDTQALEIVVSALSPQLVMKIDPGSTDANFYLSGSGLTNSAACSVEIRISDNEVDPLRTLTSSSGTLPRVLSATTLSPSSAYRAKGICEGMTDAGPTSFTVGAVGTGIFYTLNIRLSDIIKARATAADADLSSLKLYLNVDGTPAATTYNSGCNTTTQVCALTTSLASGAHTYFYYWDVNAGTVLATTAHRPAYVAIP